MWFVHFMQFMHALSPCWHALIRALASAGLFDDIWAQITTYIELPCIDCQRLVTDVYRHGHGRCIATLRCLYWLYLERILGLNWRWCHNSMILRLLARLLQSGSNCQSLSQMVLVEGL